MSKAKFGRICKGRDRKRVLWGIISCIRSIKDARCPGYNESQRQAFLDACNLMESEIKSKLDSEYSSNKDYGWTIGLLIMTSIVLTEILLILLILLIWEQ